VQEDSFYQLRELDAHYSFVIEQKNLRN